MGLSSLDWANGSGWEVTRAGTRPLAAACRAARAHDIMLTHLQQQCFFPSANCPLLSVTQVTVCFDF